MTKGDETHNIVPTLYKKRDVLDWRKWGKGLLGARKTDDVTGEHTSHPLFSLYTLVCRGLLKYIRYTSIKLQVEEEEERE